MRKLCLIHGYANLLKEVIDKVIEDKNRTNFDDILLLKCDDTNHVEQHKSKAGENIFIVPTQLYYETDANKRLPLPRHQQKSARVNNLTSRNDEIHKFFGEFTILCDRAGIQMTNQMQKLQLFDRVIEYFQKLFNEYDKVFIYSDSVPHYPIEYILDKVADYSKNSQRYYSHDTTLSNYFFITKTLEEKLNPNSWISQEDPSLKVSDWFSDYIDYLKLTIRKDLASKIDNLNSPLARFANGLNTKSKELRELGKTNYRNIFSNNWSDFIECKQENLMEWRITDVRV